ncbi:hypothetical protein KUTeg_008375 [Tegillarca granosa]|uniref:lysoplasmalogenase n=1 Tax=Tegillarca granosa TaxID=220873 RepID=A0ABQ9F902_TEGGR|nr:hypothetical protein KUTeg_008375 [Tegillarca granosa]
MKENNTFHDHETNKRKYCFYNEEQISDTILPDSIDLLRPIQTLLGLSSDNLWCSFFQSTSGPNLIGFFPKDDYNKFIMTGLIISGFGDAFMISRDTLLVPGILSFSFAHAFYLHAMDDVPYCNRLTSLFILGFLDTFLLLYKDIGSVFVMFIFLLYLTLIFITGWKAATVYETKPDSESFACAVGMLCFMFSDFILAIDLWKFHIPLSELICTTVYSVKYGIEEFITENPRGAI